MVTPVLAVSTRPFWIAKTPVHGAETAGTLLMLKVLLKYPNNSIVFQILWQIIG